MLTLRSFLKLCIEEDVQVCKREPGHCADYWTTLRNAKSNIHTDADLGCKVYAVSTAFDKRTNSRIGAMMWCRPCSPKIDQYHILELARMYFIDETERFTESRALGMARKYIRKHHPQITGLIAYSSTAEKHKGTIYLADNWFKISESKSKNGSWENRQGRTDRDLSTKYKFGRSP